MSAAKQMSFRVTRDEALLISKIIDRAAEKVANTNRMEAHMDISACIANGCPLDLQDWLEAPQFDFFHDFYGIQRHINRTTGQLEDFFVPRFATRGK